MNKLTWKTCTTTWKTGPLPCWTMFVATADHLYVSVNRTSRSFHSKRSLLWCHPNCACVDYLLKVAQLPDVDSARFLQGPSCVTMSGRRHSWLYSIFIYSPTWQNSSAIGHFVSWIFYLDIFLFHHSPIVIIRILEIVRRIEYWEWLLLLCLEITAFESSHRLLRPPIYSAIFSPLFFLYWLPALFIVPRIDPLASGFSGPWTLSSIFIFHSSGLNFFLLASIAWTSHLIRPLDQWISTIHRTHFMWYVYANLCVRIALDEPICF